MFGFFSLIDKDSTDKTRRQIYRNLPEKSFKIPGIPLMESFLGAFLRGPSLASFFFQGSIFPGTFFPRTHILPFSAIKYRQKKNTQKSKIPWSLNHCVIFDETLYQTSLNTLSFVYKFLDRQL